MANSKAYLLPKVYVEVHGRKQLSECIALVNEHVLKCKQLKDLGESVRLFEKIMYDKALNEVFDIRNNVIKKSFIVNTVNGRYILVEKGLKPYVYDVRGVRVHLLVSEGDEVKPRERIAYILTRKHETRVLKSDVEGVVVLVGYLLGEPVDHYVVLVLGRDYVKYLKPKH